jgi:hypothetical protein
LSLLLGTAVLALTVAFVGLWRARSRQRVRYAGVFDSLLTLDVSGDEFEPAELSGAPERAAAWLRSALPQGAARSRTVDVRLVGQLRAGPDDDWLPFRARERVAAGKGFIWEGRVATIGPVYLSGAEWLEQAGARSEFAWQGWLPAARTDGGDEDRSAGGRFLLEHVWLPASLLPTAGAVWEAVGERLAVTHAGWNVPLGLEIGPGGVLVSASVLRFRPDTGRMVNYGYRIEREAVFDGHRMPSRLSGGWGFGTDDYVETLRMTVESLRYF